MRGYAVVDVETTGFHAAGSDRVVEVAIVELDASGAVEGEWCTLLNPRRDLGPQHIHRIRAADAAIAPTFERVMGHIVDRLAGRVLVAHNLAFDARFLTAEFRRAGVAALIDSTAGLCTMRLARSYLPGAPKKLAECVETAGLVLTDAHSALADARAAASLLRHYLSCAGGHLQRPQPVAPAGSGAWAQLVPARSTAGGDCRGPVVRRGAAVRQAAGR